MSLYLDEKYLRFLSPSLDRFVQKHPHVFQFRCPLCGDSEKFKSKARGFCFSKGQTLIYKCHNCGIALPFAALLRRQSPRLYDEYLLEMLREKGQTRPAENSPTEPSGVPEVTRTTTPSMLLRRLDTIVVHDASTPYTRVLDYVKGRQVPDAALARLWATNSCRSWLEPLVGEDKAAKVVDGEPYLVLPLTLPNGEWYGTQVRMVSEKEYVTFRWAHDPLKVFGLDAWDPTRTTYVVEGPMDSLFVPNAIAACGSDLLSIPRILVDAQFMAPKDPVVYVWDNEPRNKEVTRHMRHAIRLREPLVIWPSSWPKDINDMVQAGYDPVAILPSRTFTGLKAELEFQVWCKS